MNDTNRKRRLIEVASVVGLWIGLGLSLHLDTNAYLLLGIPLTSAFQLGVRRQSLQALWLRDAVPFRLGTAGLAMAAALAAYPCYSLAENLRTHGDALATAWFITAIAGAPGAAYALKNFHKGSLNNLLQCLASAGAFGVFLVVLSAVAGGMGHAGLAVRIQKGVSSLLLYIPVVFVLEEVSFRGAFDAHAHHPGDSGQYWSAFFVSALWGLWHIPVASANRPWPMLVIGLIGAHCAVGVPLSLYWRRSGNLIVPGVTHAFIDAVRNALLFV